MVDRAKVNLKQCEEDLGRILRLATYGDGSMKRAWETIYRTPVADTSYHPEFAGDDSLAFTITLMINQALYKFNTYPQRTAGERKKSLSKIARAADNLIKAIGDDADADFEEIDILHEYVWSQSRSIETDPIKSGNKFPGRSTLRGALIFYRERIDQIANEKSALVRTNRPDQGLRPYVIRELSRIMLTIFDQPLDNAVALFASAILNLDQPLQRDDIRPYIKGLREEL